MPYEQIEAEKANYPVALMCRARDVSRSDYYAWKTRAPSKRDQENEQLYPKQRRLTIAFPGTCDRLQAESATGMRGTRTKSETKRSGASSVAVRDDWASPESSHWSQAANPRATIAPPRARLIGHP